MIRSLLLRCTLFLLACAGLPAAQGTILDTKHNLSVSGPGSFRASSESEVCVFCHTPHGSRTDAPLWNRADSRQSYLTYDSSTFQGVIGQPTGSSKLCLSCHDGSLALGQVLDSPSEITMRPGKRFLDRGPSFLGTDLGDDHPVSFHYASSRGGSGLEFKDEQSIVPPVHLDPNGDLQCTSCHDPHDDRQGNFLLVTDRNSTLCLACHDPEGWREGAHGSSHVSERGSLTDPLELRYDTVGENGCAACHEPHGGESGERLLRHADEEQNCLGCHDGGVVRPSIAADLSKPSRHTPFTTLGLHDPTEDPLSMARHSECQDCHDPHSAREEAVAAPGVPGPLIGASGLDGAGQAVAQIRFGFELCYKCHADNRGSPTVIPRQVVQSNVRLEFDPSNPSFHPVEAAGTNANVPSLIPPWTTASRVTCTDCHASEDSPAFGGNGAAGPHGSIFSPLLGARYETADRTQESAAAYALCYKCHSRDSILSDRSFKRHREHIVEERAPCSACHDPHGISSAQGNSTNHSHLINFDVSIVTPGSSNRLEFVDRGTFRGSCTLRCHGESHSDEDY